MRTSPKFKKAICRIAAIFFVAISATAPAQTWPASGESTLFRLPPNQVMFNSSGESTIFSLLPRPVLFNTSGESGVFSLRGQISGYDIRIGASYSHEQESIRVLADVYDRAAGGVVSSGTGIFRITQGGDTLASGALAYAPGTRQWDSGNVPLVAAGIIGVHVSVNGHTAVGSILISSTSSVQLVGWAKQDDAHPINGGMVRLYFASAVTASGDLMNLPEPLTVATTGLDGSFNLSQWPPGQYVLTLQTVNGMTIGPAFWLRSGETTHSETIIENPGRTDLLNRLSALRESIRSRIMSRQTDWMVEVADKVDADIDATPDLLDWCLLVGNIASGTAANLGKAWAAGLSPSHFGRIARAVTVESLKEKGIEVGGTILAEEASSIFNQTLGIKGVLAQPYFAYGESASIEIADFDELFTEDVKRVIDPNRTAPFLDVVFSRSNPIHRHPKDWFEALDTYDYAERWMDNYYQSAATAWPPFPSQFNVGRARRILETAEGQLRALEAGTGQIYIGPNPAEVTSSSAAHEPLALNLADYYSKYQVASVKADVLDWLQKGSSAVAIGAHGVAAASAAGVVTAPGAAIAETVAGVASGIGFGASVIQATVKADMAATYIQMGAKYCANLVCAPLVLKRTADFIATEAQTPYYLDSDHSFAGEITSVALGGVNIAGREVFFPIQLSLLPFCPPIQLTSQKAATIHFQNIPGNATAVFRVESIVRDFSGVHDHVVTPGGQMNGGQGSMASTPFRGHLMANGLLSAGTLETRLWTGPFQESRAATRDFFVMPININILPGTLVAEKEQEAKVAMQKPLGFVKSNNKAMTGEDLLAIADRVRERVETNLVVGADLITREYAFSTNIFGAEFRLYRPVGAAVAFRVEKDGEYIGWEESSGTTHLGFPGEHSGPLANPEIITVPNVGGQTVAVYMALGDVDTEAVSVLLEVWEQPTRSAVLAVLPDAVNTISRTGITHIVEIAIGESSHQHPLESVTLTATPLQSASGTVVDWNNSSWTGTTNIIAAGLLTCSMELDTRGVEDGIYTSTVTVASSNAGTITVPVSITVDGQAPAIAIQPIREWWFNPTGPVVAWSGQDNLTPSSNLLYSYILESLDGSWSGYLQTTNRDLSGIADGSYLLLVLARDQALNTTEPPVSMVIQIDRDGSRWKQRIVDADPNDGISEISQVRLDDDFDNDGASNLMEYYAGTDPTNAGDLFAFNQTAYSPMGMVIKWKAKRGYTYQVMRTTNLISGPWEEAPTGADPDQKCVVSATQDGEQIYRDATALWGPIFYKVEIK